MKKFPILSLAVASALCLYSSTSFANTTNTDGYTLEQMLILSRHNIRSPLSTNGSALFNLTTHKWHDWSSAASELTQKGGVLETIMGQYFRKYTIDKKLFTDNYIPTTDEVNIYANSMQRTIATAQYFSAAFMPLANLKVYRRYSASKMDPIFFPRLTKVSDTFKKVALEQIASFGGDKGIVGINEELKPSYDILEKVLDLKNSPACKKDKICAFNDYNTQFVFKLGEEPNLSGSLKLANSASDALILQYYEEKNTKIAAFGNELTQQDWENIAKVKDVYGDVLFAAPIVAQNVAYPLVTYIKDELEFPGRKFTFMCGHDSNIASLSAALGVESYQLNNTIEKKTPIGSKLVFEKYSDKSGQLYVDIKLVYQSTDDLRNVNLLSLQNPPQIFDIKLSDLKENKDGLYKYEDVILRFTNVQRAYESIY